MDTSLFYFSDDAIGDTPGNRYRLLMDGARFADANGFSAVWTPERHFHPFGGLYPNPAVTGAAVAAITSRVQVRAGSVVAPLHHPLRIAEEWAMVDNLSGGRVGLSLASGWHPADFALRPGAYAERRESFERTIDQIRRLWRGEEMDVIDGTGQSIRVQVYPRPVQAEVPVWVTSAGSIETFRMAGRTGSGLLTNLLGQELDDLAPKIAAYRDAARVASGGADSGHVVLMLHAFLDEDADRARDIVREPFCAYLRSSFALIAGSLLGEDSLDPASMDENDVDFLVRRSFDRYFETSGLFGTLDMAEATLDRLDTIGVDEIACQIDFGIEADTALASLSRLAEFREAAASRTLRAI
jgi:natural product biosynthesis luciferase-like monooxygenase protein